MASPIRPLIVAIGGTTRNPSSTERVLRAAANRARASGAMVEVYGGQELSLPMYAPGATERSESARRLVSSMRSAHGFIIASPGYHGSFSGLIKNALDYAEDLRQDDPAYWEGRAAGLIACAAGWEATTCTLMGMRAVVHALRGWPTPMAVGVNTCLSGLTEAGTLSDEGVDRQLGTLVSQVLSFATMRLIAQTQMRNQ